MNNVQKAITWVVIWYVPTIPILEAPSGYCDPSHDMCRAEPWHHPHGPEAPTGTATPREATVVSTSSAPAPAGPIATAGALSITLA
jgi:hypothetical protein